MLTLLKRASVLARKSSLVTQDELIVESDENLDMNAPTQVDIKYMNVLRQSRSNVAG